MDISGDSVQPKTNIRLPIREKMKAFIIPKLYH